jgi:hypothetical protein
MRRIMSISFNLRRVRFRHLARFVLCLLIATQLTTAVHAIDLASHIGDDNCVTCLATAGQHAALTADRTHVFGATHRASRRCLQRRTRIAIRVPPHPSR